MFCADDYQEGALGVLRRCVEQRLMIRVWTRNYRYVCGICVGYLVAFDKHWNLVCVCARDLVAIMGDAQRVERRTSDLEVAGLTPARALVVQQP